MVKWGREREGGGGNCHKQPKSSVGQKERWQGESERGGGERQRESRREREIERESPWPLYELCVPLCVFSEDVCTSCVFVTVCVCVCVCVCVYACV